MNEVLSARAPKLADLIDPDVHVATRPNLTPGEADPDRQGARDQQAS